VGVVVLSLRKCNGQILYTLTKQVVYAMILIYPKGKELLPYQSQGTGSQATRRMPILKTASRMGADTGFPFAI